ncbi:YncE family protein, partial [bacterium]|nr:YncE family protein [bacterium]
AGQGFLTVYNVTDDDIVLATNEAQHIGEGPFVGDFTGIHYPSDLAFINLGEELTGAYLIVANGSGPGDDDPGYLSFYVLDLLNEGEPVAIHIANEATLNPIHLKIIDDQYMYIANRLTDGDDEELGFVSVFDVYVGFELLEVDEETFVVRSLYDMVIASNTELYLLGTEGSGSDGKGVLHIINNEEYVNVAETLQNISWFNDIQDMYLDEENNVLYIATDDGGVDSNGSLTIVNLETFDADAPHESITLISNADGDYFDEIRGMDVDAVNRRLYLSSQDNHRVFVINMDDLEDITILEGADSNEVNFYFDKPHDVVFDTKHDQLYITSIDNNTLTIINTLNNTVVDILTNGVLLFNAPTVMKLDANNDLLYVVNQGGNYITVINTDTNAWHGFIFEDSFNGITNIALNTDANRLYIVNVGDEFPSISVINLDNNSLVTQIINDDYDDDILLDVQSIVYDSENRYLYIVNKGSDSVVVLDTRDDSFEIVRRFENEEIDEPDRICIRSGSITGIHAECTMQGTVRHNGLYSYIQDFKIFAAEENIELSFDNAPKMHRLGTRAGIEVLEIFGSATMTIDDEEHVVTLTDVAIIECEIDTNGSITPISGIIIFTDENNLEYTLTLVLGHEQLVAVQENQIINPLSQKFIQAHLYKHRNR